MALNIRKFTQVKKEEDMMTSMELVRQINIFRKMEGNQKEIRHDTLLVKIQKDNDTLKEFYKSNDQNFPLVENDLIKQSFYKDKKGEKRKCFLLTETQAKMFMASDSVIVRVRVTKEYDMYKNEFAIAQASTEHTKETHDKIKTLIDENNFNDMAYRTINTSINALVSDKFGLEKKTKKEDFTSSHLEFRAEVEEKIIEVIKKNKTIKLSKAQTRTILSIPKRITHKKTSLKLIK